MKFKPRLVHGLVVITHLLVFSGALAASEQTKDVRETKAMTLNFGGVDYFHRWSKNSQNEFTPQSDGNLASWHEMITVNVHEWVKDGDQLAELANKVLSNYQSHGKVLRTDSKPRTGDRPAEHLIVAVLGDPTFLESASARLILIDGVGVIVVYSHRAYGEQAGEVMSEWLKTNGPQVEKDLMAWDKVPALSALKQLPQSK